MNPLTIAEILNASPWGLSAILLAFCIYLYKSKESQSQNHFDKSITMSEKLATVIAENTAILKEVDESLKTYVQQARDTEKALAKYHENVIRCERASLK